jgi:molybdopterin-containing oxidoreductase family iron-sulfur binding subunit
MNPRKNLSPRLSALQERVGAARGKTYWRSLEELADSPAFQELMQDEFPEQAPLWAESLSRRKFLAMMGASLALAGLSGCSVRPAPTRTLVPYVRAPEEIVPGRPLFYATAMTLAGTGVGLLVEAHMGRPTKIEGNPEHPASLGATDLFHQASILTLYDPDRSQSVTQLGQPRTRDDALATLRESVKRTSKGAGVRVLTETVVSPTLGRQLRDFLDAFPKARWHQYEPLARDAAYHGAKLAFDKPVNTYYDLRDADVIVSLDAGFLSCGPGNLRYVTDFALRRRVRTTAAHADRAEMNRLYVIETAVSNTGAKADHRLPLRAGEIEGFARALAARLGISAAESGSAGEHERWVAAIAKDLSRDQRRGRCAVLAGDRQPPVVHLLAHALNERLGNVGKTVLHTSPVEEHPIDQAASLRELADAMDRGDVDTLITLGGNPVYTAPADLDFEQKMQRVPRRFHVGLYQNETARQCQWHIPEAHYLEAWGDTRAFDGTASIVQPLIEPLHGGMSFHELLSALTHGNVRPGYETVRAHWHKNSSDFDTFWQTSVHDGVIADTRFSHKAFSLRDGWQKDVRSGGQKESVKSGYEIVFQPDPTLDDGRFANNGWLQELPKPIAKLTWGNAAIMSPATARELKVDLGSYARGGERGGYHPDVVELRLGEKKVRAPVWIMPGHADGSVTVYLGHGQDFAGRVGGTALQRVGFNAYPLRTMDHPWFAPGLEVQKTGLTSLVACTQQHHLMENRDPVRSATLEEYQKSPRFAHEREEERIAAQTARIGRRPLTLYEPREYPDRRWGMVIDLTTCTGCSACVVACQAENNIPVVGREQVADGREMHWLRVDRYLSGPADNPREFHFQPVPCMHCENAPCEYVCPVEATVHSADGLNDMVYQRCVGTRFCSNNCPYKVRRFNFFRYADFTTETLRLQYNPDVTVRSRGVMEKCSYCVQRIRRAEIDAQVEGRRVADGEILTACQAVCPAQAIVFGDLNDKASTVRKWADSPLDYALLAELNTHPRTTYLAALRNPNPELEVD